MDWRKDDILADLEMKRSEGVVDREILPLLDAINGHPDYYTTSSCAGRVALLQMPKLADKRNAKFHAKWHRPVDWEDFYKAVRAWDKEEELYLVSQSPVVHVACRSIEAAVKLRGQGAACGAKYSNLRSLTLEPDGSPKKFIVELLSTENMNMPIAGRGKLYPDEDYLRFLLDTGNLALGRAQAKFERLLERIGQL